MIFIAIYVRQMQQPIFLLAWEIILLQCCLSTYAEFSRTYTPCMTRYAWIVSIGSLRNIGWVVRRGNVSDTIRVKGRISDSERLWEDLTLMCFTNFLLWHANSYGLGDYQNAMKKLELSLSYCMKKRSQNIKEHMIRCNENNFL